MRDNGVPMCKCLLEPISSVYRANVLVIVPALFLLQHVNLIVKWILCTYMKNNMKTDIVLIGTIHCDNNDQSSYVYIWTWTCVGNVND